MKAGDGVKRSGSGRKGAGDHRCWSRRRGAELEHAILGAVVAELADRGYGGLTFEGVAARAGTGKSALYRRWADRRSMTLDAIASVLPDPDDFRPTGDLRADLCALLTGFATGCAGPTGVAARVVAAEAANDPELAAMWERLAVRPWHALLERVVADAVDRGRARPGALADDCLRAGPAIICAHYTMHGVAMDAAQVASVVDNVMMPMFEPRAAADRTGTV